MVTPVPPSADAAFAGPALADTLAGTGIVPGTRIAPAGQALDTNTAGAGQQQQPGSGAAQPLPKVLDDLNGQLQAWATGMRFDIDDDAQRVVVSIVDNATGEVLRTVPSDAVIRVAKMIVQLQGKGINTSA